MAFARPDLHGQTLLMSGGSRGIGLAAALSAATAGAAVVLLAKTDTPDPRVPGTIHSAVEAIRRTGAEAVGVVGDVRSQPDVERAVRTAVDTFGSLDILVNNASAITVDPTLETTPRRFALVRDVNVTGTWLLTTAALPHLLESGGRVLTFSPPVNLSARWLGAHPAYTMSKYAMTMLTLGWAAEFAEDGLGACCLWPETLIDTAAVRNVVGGADRARSPQIMADAARELLALPVAEMTGRTFLDAELIRAAGEDPLAYGPVDAEPDLFLD